LLDAHTSAALPFNPRSMAMSFRDDGRAPPTTMRFASHPIS
jgi:hypothetical protein